MRCKEKCFGICQRLSSVGTFGKPTCESLSHIDLCKVGRMISLVWKIKKFYSMMPSFTLLRSTYKLPINFYWCQLQKLEESFYKEFQITFSDKDCLGYYSYQSESAPSCLYELDL